VTALIIRMNPGTASVATEIVKISDHCSTHARAAFVPGRPGCDDRKAASSRL